MQVLVHNAMLILNEDQEVPSVLNPTTGKVFLVSGLGMAILKSCDGSMGVEELVRETSECYPDVPISTIKSDVEQFVKQGVEGGLLVWQERTAKMA